MPRAARTLTLAAPSLLRACGMVFARLSQDGPSRAISAEISALKVDTVAWRKIAWKSWLLEGLAKSRAKKKPGLRWVFIDCPADDDGTAAQEDIAMRMERG